MDNIYTKLNQARIELKDLKLPKSGENQSMRYYELGDFLPAVLDLSEKYKFITTLNLYDLEDGREKAVLTVINLEDPKDRVQFEAPTREAKLPKGQPIQNQGAKITYMRRYMLMTAFEIAESDIVDSVKRSLTEEISEKDEEWLRKSKNRDELSARAKELMDKYKKSLIAPLYKELEKNFIDEEEVEKEGKKNES